MLGQFRCTAGFGVTDGSLIIACQMSLDEMRSMVSTSTGTQSTRTCGYAQRLRVASDFQEARDLFKQLKREQSMLDDLVQTGSSRVIQPLLVIKPKTDSLQLLRKRMTALYTVLARLAKCEEHVLHRASLGLEFRDPMDQCPDVADNSRLWNK